MRKISPRLIYFFGALDGLLFGYDTGVISGAMSIGPPSDRFGRKKMVMVAALIFFIGSLGSAFSPDFGLLIASRVVLGVAVGGASALVPTYYPKLRPLKCVNHYPHLTN